MKINKKYKKVELLLHFFYFFENKLRFLEILLNHKLLLF